MPFNSLYYTYDTCDPKRRINISMRDYTSWSAVWFVLIFGHFAVDLIRLCCTLFHLFPSTIEDTEGGEWGREGSVQSTVSIYCL